MQAIRKLSPSMSVTGQLQPEDMVHLSANGYRTIINNRYDSESPDQSSSAELEAAARAQGLGYHYLPVVSGQVSDPEAAQFRQLMIAAEGPVLAFCRSGMRSATLWALTEVHHQDAASLLANAAAAGCDLSALRDRLTAVAAANGQDTVGGESPQFDVVVVGGGAAGSAVTASLLKRDSTLRIAVIEPRDEHYYQPGWTLVGAGVFTQAQTRRDMTRCIPARAQRIRGAVTAFAPDRHQVVLEDGSRIGYRALVVCPGLVLDWDAIEGAREALGQHGVTSNYAFDLAPYTWQQVQNLKRGKVLFAQPPMPIKCAGAPQKAMYLSCDHWQRQGVLKDIQVEFMTAGAVLFGVETFVPPLMEYVKRYGAQLNFGYTLIRVDGKAKKAWFRVAGPEGESRIEEREFDMLHIVPPQRAPDFIRESALANADGWFEVNPETLVHPRYSNIFALGDACSAPNAKTAAAVRKQAPVVADNLLRALRGRGDEAVYDGYGSCPLTVERGKVVLAEFGYGGKLLPTFPLNPAKPSRLAWVLKANLMPFIYFGLMLKGHEWLARPRYRQAPLPAAVDPACDYEGKR